MAEETVFEAVRRLQQKMDLIDQEIVLKRKRIRDKGYTGPLQRMIEREIEKMKDHRSAIHRNILELKRIAIETQITSIV